MISTFMCRILATLNDVGLLRFLTVWQKSIASLGNHSQNSLCLLYNFEILTIVPRRRHSFHSLYLWRKKLNFKIFKVLAQDYSI